MLKLGTFFRKSVDFSSKPCILSKKESSVTLENGRDAEHHLGHNQLLAEDETFLSNLAH